MRMRFCATMRRPAFSISALTAPVRLRSVASGLMIEKVRSIAMFRPQITGDAELRRLYRRDRPTASDRAGGADGELPRELRQFHKAEPFLKAASRFRSPGQA